MAKYLLFTFLFLAGLVGLKAQTGNVIEADSTNFEVNSSLAELDTLSSNIWQIGLPLKPFFGMAHSAPFAIMTDTLAPYPANNSSSFIVSMDSSIWGMFPDGYISFWHMYETDAGKDGGYVEISIDSGFTWANVIDPYPIGIFYFQGDNFYGPSDTIKGGIPAFNGTQNSWTFSKIYLQWLIPVIAPYGGIERGFWDTQKIMFRFTFNSDGINTGKAGWIIDNIEIGYQDVGGSVSKNVFKESFDVLLFPNPLTDRSVLQVISPGKEKNYVLHLYNSTGQLISLMSADVKDQFIIEKNGLESGIYFYSVSDRDGSKKSGKLMIQ